MPGCETVDFCHYLSGNDDFTVHQNGSEDTNDWGKLPKLVLESVLLRGKGFDKKDIYNL